MSDKYLIVGLGNPGKQYEATRHNVGFMAVEAFARRAGIEGKTERKFNAIVGTGKHRGHALIVAQPLTFMNLSGEAVVKLLNYYEVEPERLLVIYDEAALPFGKIRIRPSGSDAGQKGMKSIIQCLGGNKDIPRLRIGIGGPPAKMAMPDYVLGKFDEEERKDLPNVLDTVMDTIDYWLDNGMEAAMTRYNGASVLTE
jgi:PTH1 family peptidyl-tRNA hydrolase